MKALQVVKYGEIKDSLVFNEVRRPSVNANDLLIEIKAAAVNPIDKSLVLGNMQKLLPLSLPTGIGYDVSGIVVDKGEKVDTFAIGDLVYARVPQAQMGTLAEYVTVIDTAASKKPENISFEEAAGLPLVGLTAMQSLEAAGIKNGDIVLIHAGSGGVGSFAIQYAKAKGAYVYTTTGTDNVEWVKALGADRVIDHKTEDYKTIVKDADIVFDTLGHNYTLEAFQVIKKGGTVVSLVGPLDEATAVSFGMKDYELPDEIALKCKEKDASYIFIFMHPSGDGLGKIKSLVEAGKIKPVIDTIFPFSKSIDALTQLATGKAKGKIVIHIS